ncbi:uncharacterized protein LOC127903695 [Citrus sinensis]|uniref:uncharacterized protein LOC127903695 n=1 Tax=Citrus sinensis TaxID=2711 RepID=UPI002279D694|nr:uncharacterized protein LOC127903695 [Citrus sinensis]
MSKGKEKIIEVDDDELDFLPSLLADAAFDPGIPLEPIRSSIGTNAKRMSPQTTSSSQNSGDEGSSGSEDTPSEDQGGDSGEMPSPETSRPEVRSTVGGRALSQNYAIDFITCTTTVDELTNLRVRYEIPDEISLRVPGKKDTPSRPPKGYVTMFLESFKYGLRCCQSEPTVDEVKYLYQLKSSPKDADWYYFQSSTKSRKPITDILTGGGGTWKKKIFFAWGLWGQVTQIDGKDYRVLPRFMVPSYWSVHFPLKPDQLKRVEVVLVNSCSNRELLITYNLVKSGLVSTGHKMEDAVIGALTQKRPRPQAAKRDQNKDAPTAKRANIMQQVPPLKTLPPPPAKVGETSGAATDPASSSPPIGPRSRLSDNRAEHLVPYMNELSKLVSKKDLEDFDGCTLGELVGAMQYNAFYLSCIATYYKAKVGHYDRKMKEDIQSAITFEEELTKVKEDLQRQKVMYEAQLESLRDSYRAQVENLKKDADNQYDQRLRHSYRCIMAVLGKQHPDLKMGDLAAGVAQHVDEEAAKEDVEEVEPIVVEEENSPPRAVPTDVGEASTPRTQLVIPPCP